MEKNKRKAFIIQREFCPSRGGDSRRIDELASFLKDNFDIKILTAFFSEIKSPMGNEIIRVKPNPYNFFSRWIFCFVIIFKFLKEKADIIYINAPFLEASIIVFFCKILKIKCLINMTLMGQDGPIDLLKRTKYPKFLAKIFLNILGKSDYILSLGSGLAKQGIEYGWKREKIILLGPAKDPNIYHPPLNLEEKIKLRKQYGFNEDDFLCIFVGYLIPRKGFYDLVSVWKEVAKEIKCAKLVIVGAKREGFEEWADDQIKKLDNSFKYLGALSREKVAEALRMSDLFLFPTYREGLGAVIIEAMMTGLPIITTNLEGSTADLIKDGKNGILIEAGDKVALKEAILKIYKDKILRENFAKNALKSSYEYHIENIKNKYMEIFSI